MDKTILISIPVEEFQSIIVDCVNNCLKHNPSLKTQANSINVWFDLNKLVEYDPEKRSKPTFYGYIAKREIPFHKRGKKLTFLKSEIDEWLKQGRKKTIKEIVEEADNYLSKTNKG